MLQLPQLEPASQPNRLIRSYGRIKSRKLSDSKKSLLTEILPIYNLNNEDLVNIRSKNILEIGFGFGDFLFAKAKNNPDINYIGFEPHLNGVVNLLAKLQENPLTNLKICNSDVRASLAKIGDLFFDEIYILFPDPWPKQKHYKRRLINLEFLETLAKKIKNGGKLIIATDHDSYKTWILAAILKSDSFKLLVNNQNDWLNFPDDWVVTKYQKKAIAEGRNPVIFKLEKCLN